MIKNTLAKAVNLIRKNKSLLLISLAAFSVASIVSYVILRTSLPVSLVYQKNDVKVDQSVVISLSQFIQLIDAGDIQIQPAIEGSWQFVRNTIADNGTLVFTPKKYFTEHTTYTVNIGKATRLYGNEADIPAATFTTEKAPSLAQSGMANWKDKQIIAADATFSVDLVSQNRNLRDLELRTTPQIETTLSSVSDKEYTWKPTTILPQNIDLSIEIYDRKNHQSLLKKVVHTAAEPSVTSPLQHSDVDEHDNINITFSAPVERSTANIAFDLAGKGEWKNDTTYTFTPDKLNANTTYHYTISKNMRSKDGGILLNDVAGSFSTIGPVRVTATSPSGHGLGQGSQTVSFTFSRPVDHASAEQRLSASSGQITSKSWKGNTLYATFVNLGFQTTFRATMAAGVANTTFGAPSSQAFSLSFTTEIRSIKLSVPYYRQQFPASCAAASLRMILAYRGISTDDMSIIQKMGYRPRSMDKSTDPPTWDDPSEMYVGDVNGTISAGTGAGPDAPPTAKAARAYGRGASSVTNIGSSWIAQQLYNNNPVVMFGAFRSTNATVSWKTPSGRITTMNVTSHATAVIGVRGEPSAPLGFWVNDPLKGAQYWSTEEVDANIARDPYRQAVVVY